MRFIRILLRVEAVTGKKGAGSHVETRLARTCTFVSYPPDGAKPADTVLASI
jgi:hypothetical protein